MENLKVEEAKKIYDAIRKSKLKHYTVESLANDIGIYHDILASKLSIFNPLMHLDTNFNLKEIEKDIKEYIDKKMTKTKKGKTIDPEVSKYKSLNDFIYQKYAISGGLMDKNVVLSNKDLNTLKKLAIMEKKNRK